MKSSLARRWAAALESGEYQQTDGRLRNGGNFCCLGVLCNLHAQDHPEIAQDEDDPDSYLGADTDLPTLVKDWAGMACTGGAFSDAITDSEGNYRHSLIELNDEAGYTFPEIAKVIRKHWKEL